MDGLVAHAVDGVVWLEPLLREAEPVGLRPSVSRSSSGRTESRGEAVDPFAACVRAVAEAFAITGALLVNRRRHDLPGRARRAPRGRAGGPSRACPPVPREPGAFGDYVRTRVFEVVVQGDDIVCRIPGMSVPDPPLAAVDVSLVAGIELAGARVGDRETLRASTRAERVPAEALRVL